MNKCSSCHTENRDSAKYCKECGALLLGDDPFANMIAKDDQQALLKKFKNSCRTRHTLEMRAGKDMAHNIGLDCLITGDAGTGKNYLADLLYGIAVKEQVVANKGMAVYDASEIDGFNKNLDSILLTNADGIILITNAQKLVAESVRESTPLDKLFSKMSSQKKMPIIFLSGLRMGMDTFLKRNPDIVSKFEYSFKLGSFSDKDLTDLACQMLSSWKISIEDAARNRMQAHFKHLCRTRDDSFENADLAVKKATEFLVNMETRGGSKIQVEDIQGEVFVQRTEKEILEQLDAFVGMESVKEEIRSIIDSLKVKRRAEGPDAVIRLTDHFVFTGNPGTGKTTMARIFAEILASMEVLPSGQLIEANRKDLVGAYMGSTAQKVEQIVSKAIGGILFIDEAYALKGGTSDEYGQEAIDTLLPILENRRGEFICIIAGYTKEMGDFLRTNSGLESRFNKTIHFPDYNAKELHTIFMNQIRSAGYRLTAEATEKLPNFFGKMYLSRRDTFGNAREVRNVFQRAAARLDKRRARMTDTEFLSAGNTLEWEDIVGKEEAGELSVENVMKELDQFVGMSSVKHAIQSLAEEMAYNKQRLDAGIGSSNLTAVNIILTGNPGTGKTTVVRILGRLFKAMGLTQTDRVVEKSRKDIVGQYVNQSDKLMDDAINAAMGGVLFLDEAYSIAPVNDLGRCTDEEGVKALERLMTRMENDKGKFVLICAGYKNKMEQFLRVNSGLKSRFTHNIDIEDYSADELQQIYMQFLAKDSYQLESESVKEKILKMFEALILTKDDAFGNAREARRMYEQTKRNVASRLRGSSGAPLNIVTAADIPYQEPKAVSADDCLAELNELIGLKGVKGAMQKLVATINVQQKLAKTTGGQMRIPVGHFMFLGNPGTGKTTVARLMGKILYSMGVLSKPDVVEVDKSQLVAGYVGQSEEKTAEVIRRAMGGILFIDEAYELAADQFGRNSLDILLKQLEDKRDRFVCIVAGYTREMQDFITSNSGLSSRFPERNCIEFDDYDPTEMYDIFNFYCQKESMTITPAAQAKLKSVITDMYNKRNHQFGNAREVRNLFDKIKINLSFRVAGLPDATLLDMRTIQEEDI